MRLDYNKLAEARKKKGLTLGFAAEKNRRSCVRFKKTGKRSRKSKP